MHVYGTQSVPRSAGCGGVEDATPLDTFPSYGGPLGGPLDGTMTVARRKPGQAVPPGAGALPGVAGAPGAPAFNTLDSRARCANAGARPLAHTHTLPHPPRQF